MDNKKQTNRVAAFFKKNVYYILIVLCVLAVITMITVAVIATSHTPEVIAPEQPRPDPPVITPQPFILAMPVAGSQPGLGFFDNELVGHQGGHWTAHLGIDLMVERGTPVHAAYAGRVIAIDNTPLTGAVITIEHRDGYVTVYKMLDQSSLRVTVGSNVTQGQIIANVGHVPLAVQGTRGDKLHFQLLRNNVHVNPANYLENGEK